MTYPDSQGTRSAIEDDVDEFPDYVHPDCVDICGAMRFRTCCKYPDTSLGRRLCVLVEDLDEGEDAADEPALSADLARRLARLPDLLRELPQDLSTLPTTEVFHLACLLQQVNDHLYARLQSLDTPQSDELRRRAEDASRATALLREPLDRLWDLAGQRLRESPNLQESWEKL